MWSGSLQRAQPGVESIQVQERDRFGLRTGSTLDSFPGSADPTCHTSVKEVTAGCWRKVPSRSRLASERSYQLNGYAKAGWKLAMG